MFDDKDYKQFKFQMKCVLKAKGLYSIARDISPRLPHQNSVELEE